METTRGSRWRKRVGEGGEGSGGKNGYPLLPLLVSPLSILDSGALCKGLFMRERAHVCAHSFSWRCFAGLWFFFFPCVSRGSAVKVN